MPLKTSYGSSQRRNGRHPSCGLDGSRSLRITWRRKTSWSSAVAAEGGSIAGDIVVGTGAVA